MKGIKLVLALGVLAGILPGCAGKKETQTETGPVTIELWYGAAVTEAGSPPPDWKALQLIKDKLNINLVLSALPSNESDQDVKINAAAAANALPDLFMVRRDPWLNITRVGVIAPVDDLYAQMPNRTKIQYDPDSRGFTTLQGKSYGLASPGNVAKNEGLLIRKDWLDKLKLPVPSTTEDLFAVMKAFTTQDPDGNGRADTYGYGAFIEINNFEEGLGRRFDPLFGAFGVAGTWNLTASAAGLNLRKSAYFDALNFVKRMVDEKVIDPNWTSYGKDDFRAAWKQGRFGIMREQNGAFAAESNYAPFDKNFPDGEWIVIDPPEGPEGHKSVGVYTQAYRIYAVSTKAMQAGKGPAIARLLEWMSSHEGYYLLGWGEQGVNYVLGPDGAPTVEGLPDASKGFIRPEMQVLTQLRNMVFYNSEVELLARYPTYQAPTSGKTMSALTVLLDMQKRPWTPNIGADALPAPNADLKRFYEQGVVEFLTGQRELNRNNWEAWVAEFDRLGGLEWEKAGIAAAEANGYLK
ncbi:MAG: extracellular solute-binding protein [Spirochaetaceae bacterium]|jgi:putative aldouronate transport system substrate-binding protein|nr:extracellular solute-binding protein [Spirochaetaceae bacterium]